MNEGERGTIGSTGRIHGLQNFESTPIAVFLSLGDEEPTPEMIEYIDNYIDGWLEWVKDEYGYATHELVDGYFTDGAGPKWTQKDIIGEIRIARRDWQGWIDKVAQHELDLPFDALVDPQKYNEWAIHAPGYEANKIAEALITAFGSEVAGDISVQLQKRIEERRPRD